MFFIIFGDVPVDPLPMSDVQELANEVVCPIVGSEDTVCGEKMGMLYGEEELRDFAFHEVVPPNEILLVSQAKNVDRSYLKRGKFHRAVAKDVLRTQTG
jgi:hypothetical protein